MNVLEICRQKLQEGGLRLTRQREQILTIMYEHQGEHLTREGISNLVQREYPSVGKATVYRTITVFEKLGIVSRNNLDERVRYELADPEQVHEHHHMICLACGRIAEMQGDFLETQEVSEEMTLEMTKEEHRSMGLLKQLWRSILRSLAPMM